MGNAWRGRVGRQQSTPVLVGAVWEGSAASGICWVFSDALKVAAAESAAALC